MERVKGDNNDQADGLRSIRVDHVVGASPATTSRARVITVLTTEPIDAAVTDRLKSLAGSDARLTRVIDWDATVSATPMEIRPAIPSEADAASRRAALSLLQSVEECAEAWIILRGVVDAAVCCSDEVWALLPAHRAGIVATYALLKRVASLLENRPVGLVVVEETSGTIAARFAAVCAAKLHLEMRPLSHDDFIERGLEIPRRRDGCGLRQVVQALLGSLNGAA